jgi:hypothetical protein
MALNRRTESRDEVDELAKLRYYLDHELLTSVELSALENRPSIPVLTRPFDSQNGECRDEGCYCSGTDADGLEREPPKELPRPGCHVRICYRERNDVSRLAYCGLYLVALPNARNSAAARLKKMRQASEASQPQPKRAPSAAIAR